MSELNELIPEGVLEPLQAISTEQPIGQVADVKHILELGRQLGDRLFWELLNAD